MSHEEFIHPNLSEQRWYIHGQINIAVENHRASLARLERARNDVRTSLKTLVSLRDGMKKIEGASGGAIMSAARDEPAATLQPIESTMKDVFGDHPTNVIAHIQYGAEALDWMESIFHAIEKLHDNEGSGSHIKKLAGLGKYVAFDISNTLGCQYEEYSEKLEAAIAESEAAK